ncbi:MAG: GUN4 domain-containing protein [Crocosphaera sp.]
MDYTPLRDLLATGNWQSADLETAKVMCQAASREKQRWLRLEDIHNFPCEDLLTINQLWLHYSNGKFGFSIQKEIYERLKPNLPFMSVTTKDDETVWKRFSNRVGWRNPAKKHSYSKWLDYSELTFNLNVPQGHLPAFGYISTYEQFSQSDYGIGGYERCTEGLMVTFYADLFSLVNTCLTFHPISESPFK